MDRLLSGQSLAVGQALISRNRRHRAALDDSGNFVLTRSASGSARWASSTQGRGIEAVLMRADGNLVISDAGAIVWESDTAGHAGAMLVMQDDGNLVIRDARGEQVWSTGTNVTMMRVTGFLPGLSGFRFSNADFRHVPHVEFSVLGRNVAIGDAGNGLCGGMVFAVRDFFQARRRPPPRTDAPSTGVLYDYLVRRLYDSFELPGGPLRYAFLMNPDLPDHETALSEAGFAPHGRAWLTIVDEWPRIRASLDAGLLTPMALIKIKSHDVLQMGGNHQVLAYGYDLDGTDLVIHVYDPNYPGNDTCCICLNTGNPRHTTTMQFTYVDEAGKLQPEDVYAFFGQRYSFVMPPVIPARDVGVPQRSFKITNDTNANLTVKVFNPGDLAMLAPLPTGEFTVEPRKFATWVFHATLPQVRVTANDRFQGLVSPGAEITVTVEDSVQFRNSGSVTATVHVYKSDDTLMWAELPGGNFPLAPNMHHHYMIPLDVTAIKAVINGRTFTAMRGGTVVF